MRFGSLDDLDVQDDLAAQSAPPAHVTGPMPAAEWVPEAAAMGSPRLRRANEYFAAQEALLHDVRWQVELELAPFVELMQRQQATTRETLANLEPQLRPLHEFLEAEEVNLDELERNMTDADMGFLSRSFAKHAESLRDRIGETRRHIESQRSPFLRFDDDTRGVVDVALARLDTDLGALEQNLAEQRRVMHRLLDAMRSEPFVAARDLLLARQAVIEELTAAGVTEPAEIVKCLQALRANTAADGGGAQLQRVLAATDAADARLAGAVGSARVRRASVTPSPAADAADETRDERAAEEPSEGDTATPPRSRLRRPWG